MIKLFLLLFISSCLFLFRFFVNVEDFVEPSYNMRTLIQGLNVFTFFLGLPVFGFALLELQKLIKEAQNADN